MRVEITSSYLQIICCSFLLFLDLVFNISPRIHRFYVHDITPSWTGSVDSTFVMCTFGLVSIVQQQQELLFLRKLTKKMISHNSVGVCIKSKYELKQ